MHVFVDESERANRYLMCAVIVAPTVIREVRRALQQLCLPGQYRIHMTKERPARRRLILGRIGELPLRCRIYASPTPVAVARAACLTRMVVDLDELPLTRLVVEPVESYIPADISTIFHAALKIAHHRFTYEHVLARHEPILWAADAVAWAVGAGGDWLRRAAGVVERTVAT